MQIHIAKSGNIVTLCGKSIWDLVRVEDTYVGVECINDAPPKLRCPTCMELYLDGVDVDSKETELTDVQYLRHLAGILSHQVGGVMDSTRLREIADRLMELEPAPNDFRGEGHAVP